MVLSNIHFTLVEKESSKVQFNEWDELSPLVEVPVQSYEWESALLHKDLKDNTLLI